MQNLNVSFRSLRYKEMMCMQLNIYKCNLTHFHSLFNKGFLLSFIKKTEEKDKRHLVITIIIFLLLDATLFYSAWWNSRKWKGEKENKPVKEKGNIYQVTIKEQYVSCYTHPYSIMACLYEASMYTWTGTRQMWNLYV